MSPDEEIIKIVTDYWKNHRRPLLLSALGGLVSQDAKDCVKGDGLTLGQHIRRNMSDDVRLLRLQSHGGGVVPASVTEKMSDDELESLVPLPTPRLDLGRTRSPKIASEIWQLFRDGTDTLPVFVNIMGEGEVQISKNQGPSPNSFAVTAEDLPTGDQPWPIAAVGNAIRAWASKHDIAMRQLHNPHDDVERKGALARGSKPMSLKSALDVLSVDELRRISIPADIVLSILKRI